MSIVSNTVELSLTGAVSVATLLALLQFLFSMWLKHYYDKRLKNYENQFKMRERASHVAEFFAAAYDPQTQPARFNQLAWEISLWLPAELVIEISRCLAADENRKNPKEILIGVRKILLNDQNDLLKPENILHREYPNGPAKLTEDLLTDPIVRSMTG